MFAFVIFALVYKLPNTNEAGGETDTLNNVDAALNQNEHAATNTCDQEDIATGNTDKDSGRFYDKVVEYIDKREKRNENVENQPRTIFIDACSVART